MALPILKNKSTIDFHFEDGAVIKLSRPTLGQVKLIDSLNTSKSVAEKVEKMIEIVASLIEDDSTLEEKKAFVESLQMETFNNLVSELTSASLKKNS